MVFESLEGFFRKKLEMNTRGGKLVRGLFLGKDLLEKITSGIVHDLEIGIVTSSPERDQEFLDAFVDECA